MAMPTGEHCWKKNSDAPWARTSNLWIPNLISPFSARIEEQFQQVICASSVQFSSFIPNIKNTHVQDFTDDLTDIVVYKITQRTQKMMHIVVYQDYTDNFVFVWPSVVNYLDNIGLHICI